ncbi:MAG: TonB-dependent receptor [Ignavibacteria bacterium]|nr:TonB-dependent receptor [Ignavibacteria bacterium]
MGNYRFYPQIFLLLFVLSISYSSFSQKIETTSFLKIIVVDENSAPIPQTQIYLDTIKNIFLTNSLGLTIIQIPRYSSLKMQFKKIGYNTLDTVVSIDQNLDTNSFFVKLSPKNFKSKEVVVTATRTDKELQNHPMPVRTILIEEIKPISTFSLGEILKEFTSLMVIDDYTPGSGVQVQGLDPDYTLILINGEPLGNRTGEVFDISSFFIGNLSKIEIVRGPHSSIYGSNALAGVINIITEEPNKPTDFTISGRYGSHSTYNIYSNLKKVLLSGILSTSIYYNFWRTSGYKLNPNSVGKTVPDINQHTLHTEGFWNITNNSRLKISFRSNFETEQNQYLTKTSTQSDTIKTKNDVKDINTSILYKNIVNKYLNYEFRTYHSFFSSNTKDHYLKNGDLFDSYFFEQNLHKIEFQANFLPFAANYVTFGAGFQTETAKSLSIAEGSRLNTQFYLYLQDDFYPYNNLNIITSLRFDRHSNYPPQFSPKLAVSYELIPEVTLRGSFGTGFKAPTFEELYLDWTLSRVGYSVFGVAYVPKGIAKLKEQGQIAEFLISPDSIPTLKPEKSVSFDFGWNIRLSDILFTKINFFRNNVTNLIDFVPIAIKTNAQRVHTYRNINRIFTQGLELTLEVNFLKYFRFSTSYQYLETGDLDVINRIKSKKEFKRDQNGFDRPVLLSEYGGLFLRPRNSGIFRMTYNNESLGLNTSITLNLKSSYGYRDINGNNILDDNLEYAPGYAILNFHLYKTIFDKFSVNFTINNILDKKDRRMLSPTPGRTFSFTINYNYVQQ